MLHWHGLILRLLRENYRFIPFTSLRHCTCIDRTLEVHSITQFATCIHIPDQSHYLFGALHIHKKLWHTYNLGIVIADISFLMQDKISNKWVKQAHPSLVYGVCSWHRLFYPVCPTPSVVGCRSPLYLSAVPVGSHFLPEVHSRFQNHSYSFPVRPLHFLCWFPGVQSRLLRNRRLAETTNIGKTKQQMSKHKTTNINIKLQI